MDEGLEALPKLVERLTDADVTVRFWAANGLTNLGTQAAPASKALLRALKDPSPEVRIAAAQALCRMGREQAALPVLASYLTDKRLLVRVAAANVVDRIGARARPIVPDIQNALSIQYPDLKQGASWLPWLLQHTLRSLNAPAQR
jgi:HEAT repeat protein